MQAGKPRFDKHLFVCEHSRAEGACCAQAGARLREKLKEAVLARGLTGRVRVCRSGCLDACAEGPNVLLEPDHVWFRAVSPEDLDAVIERTAEGL